MSVEIKVPKKLIEVALPLDIISAASAHEKTIRQGHPSSLHLWWARRPLAAARAVIFAQMVNDPGYQSGHGFKFGKNKADALVERERLFKIMADLVSWENTNNEEVLSRARAEIRRSWRETCELNKDHPQARELFNPEVLPAFHDPFAGGGAIPLEAQRLGLESYASDLNPVAVTINKAMIEIPARFIGKSPVGPTLTDYRNQNLIEDWSGVKGLSEDIRRYGDWIKHEALRRIGHLYPQIEITSAIAKKQPNLLPFVGQKFNVISWLWARTVKSPNPAFSHVSVPLISSFVISSNKGKEAFIEPIVNGDTYSFEVKSGVPPARAFGGTKSSGRGANFNCLISGAPISAEYIKSQGQSGKIGERLMAIVAEGPRGRLYISPTAEHENSPLEAKPINGPDIEFFQQALGFRIGNYGLSKWSDLFTSRQLVALSTLSSLILEAVDKCKKDALANGQVDDGLGIDAGGLGATAYSQAVGVYLSFAMSKQADLGNSLCRWEPIAQCPRQLFGRQAIPMIWDFAEGNPLGESSGSWVVFVDGIAKAFKKSFDFVQADWIGRASQADAATQVISKLKVISTDPPYYDNIGYADLSDFFYVWLQRNLFKTFPQLYSNATVPKIEELVATPFRHGGKEQAEAFFLNGMTKAIINIVKQGHPAFPVTIYYAFKQTETDSEGATSSTGWETFLQAILNSGLSITGTWPMRTENSSRMRGQSSNALASCVVLVCRIRPANAITVSRRDFIRELNSVLPISLDEMTRGGVNSPVAPVDLSQAIIGPGMEIFTKYTAVLEADGQPMSVRVALQLINRFLSEDDFDHETQFCLNWFEQRAWSSGKFGEADVLARAKGTSVEKMSAMGIIESASGKINLIPVAQLDDSWSLDGEQKRSVWDILHQMIRLLNTEGESGASKVLARMGQYTDSIRTLAYRLYTLCERNRWAQDSSQYDQLIRAWDGIEAAARIAGYSGSQISLFGEDQSTDRSQSSNSKKKTRKKKT